MNTLDLKLISPQKKTETFNNNLREYFVIPCNIIEIGERINYNSFKIIIERLDFYSGELIVHQAIIVEKTLNSLYESDLKLPLLTECKIYFNENNNLYFVVYSLITPGILLFLNINENKENQLIENFHKNYFELRNWIENKINN